MSGHLDDESRDGGSHHTGQVSDAILESGPAAGGDGTGQGLGDRPMAGGIDSIGGAGEDQKADRHARIGDEGNGDDDRGEAQTQGGAGPADPRRCRSGGDGAIGQPGGRGRGHGGEKKRQGAHDAHRLHGEMPVPNEVGGKPGQKKIPKIIGAEQSRERDPGRPVAEDFTHARRFLGAGRGQSRAPGPPFGPKRQPRQGAHPQQDEKRPPADMRHQLCPGKGPEGRPEFGSDIDPGIGQTPLILSIMRGEDFRVGRIRHRFGHSDQQTEHEEAGKTGDQSRPRGRSGPKEEPGSQDPARIVTVHQPARDELKGGIAPKKGPEQDPQLGGVEPEFVFDQRRGDGKISAIDIIDDHRRDQQEARKPKHA